MDLKKNKKVAVFGYDFGGAFNTIIFLIKKKYNLKKIDFFFFGPSKSCLTLLKKKISVKKNFSNFEIYNQAIYSLSNVKNKEFLFLKNIKKNKIPTKLILDGWGNYQKKMAISKINLLPDEIITFDTISFKIVSKLIKNPNIKLYRDLIFNFFKKNIKKRKKNYLLFLQTKSLKKKKTVERILSACKKKNIQFKFRNHPSWQSKKHSIISSMFKDISGAKYILGDHSSMLIYGSVLGSKSLCFCKKGVDKFGWNKYRIFNRFNIKKIYNINNLERNLI